MATSLLRVPLSNDCCLLHGVGVIVVVDGSIVGRELFWSLWAIVSSFRYETRSSSVDGISFLKLSFLLICSIDFVVFKSLAAAASRAEWYEILLVDMSISERRLVRSRLARFGLAAEDSLRKITSIERRWSVFLSKLFPDGVLTEFKTSYDFAPDNARYELYCLMSFFCLRSSDSCNLGVINKQLIELYFWESV